MFIDTEEYLPYMYYYTHYWVWERKTGNESWERKHLLVLSFQVLFNIYSQLPPIFLFLLAIDTQLLLSALYSTATVESTASSNIDMSSALFYACWYTNRVNEALRLLATANSADVNYRDEV